MNRYIPGEQGPEMIYHSQVYGMAPVEMTPALQALVDKAHARNVCACECCRVRARLVDEKDAEIERLRKALGEQTEAVRKWRNRERNARRRARE